MEVVVTDQGGLSDTASVTITVERNLNSPAFLGSGQYSVTIVENFPLATRILQVSATDQDLTVSRRTICHQYVCWKVHFLFFLAVFWWFFFFWSSNRCSGFYSQTPHNTLVFSITSDASSQEYFTVNDQGEIMLKKSPTLDRSISSFQVSGRHKIFFCRAI